MSAPMGSLPWYIRFRSCYRLHRFSSPQASCHLRLFIFPSIFATMLDKRTSRSRNFKNFLQLQQQPLSNSKCDIFPWQQFDFTLADSSASTVYEFLKRTYLYLDATQSPICSTLLTVIHNFEEFVVHSSHNFSTAVALSLQCQLAVPSPSGHLLPCLSRPIPSIF